MWKKSICAVALLVAGMHTPGANAAPEVVVSIKPVHSLVAGVMRGVGQPWLMVPGAASPHMYQMRPSEAKKLRDADLIVWVGENMETFLDRPISNLGSGATVVTLHEAAGMRLLPNREGGIWKEEEAAEVHKDEQDDHGHEHDEFDMHIWLDPGNAGRIVSVVADALIRVDPANAAAYRRNEAEMRKRIDAQVAALRKQLAPVRKRAFIVFHDGYRYFEHAFGLTGVGAVAIDPARPPGARRLAELRRALVARNVLCVFTEPQFEPDLVRTVVEGTKVRTGALDPIGVAARPGPEAWFEIMRGLGNAFERCLGAD